MTQEQVQDEHFLTWLHERASSEVEEIERSVEVMEVCAEHDISLMDILHVLRGVRRVVNHYQGGCFTVSGTDLDGRRLAIVVAPPSNRNRIRLVRLKCY